MSIFSTRCLVRIERNEAVLDPQNGCGEAERAIERRAAQATTSADNGGWGNEPWPFSPPPGMPASVWSSIISAHAAPPAITATTPVTTPGSATAVTTSSPTTTPARSSSTSLSSGSVATSSASSNSGTIGTPTQALASSSTSSPFAQTHTSNLTSHTVAIAVGVGCGVATLFLVGILAFWLLQRRESRKRKAKFASALPDPESQSQLQLQSQSREEGGSPKAEKKPQPAQLDGENQIHEADRTALYELETKDKPVQLAGFHGYSELP